MLKSLLTNLFNRYLLSATSVTDVYYVLNLSVNITENIPILWRLHFIGERGEQTNKKIQKKKSKLYSTLESAKGKKNGEREVEGIRRPCE